MGFNKKPPGQRAIAKRIGLLTFLLWGLIFILICRYFYIQIIEGEQFSSRIYEATGGAWMKRIPRAAIVDRNGRELAVTLIMKSLFVDPNHVRNKDDVATKLAPLISLTADEIRRDIDVGGGFVWVKHFLAAEEVSAVRKLIRQEGYNCLGFLDEPKRFYPNDMLAANVLGFVGTDDIGLYGIEQAYDKELKGDAREIFLYTDKGNNPILSSARDTPHYDGTQGKKVVLTIDSTIQFTVEQALDEIMRDNKPLSATAIVLNPKTGEILAMADRPTFNPNRFETYAPETWSNRAVSFLYEPGSTFKTVIAAAALAEHIATPQRVFVDPGKVHVSDRVIQNWNDESFGTVTFTDVIRNSINTCFAQVGLELGPKRLLNYASLFGFGESTGIELPGDEPGIMYDVWEMFDPEVATMAIGHSITVTPLQLATAVSAIANDGVLMRPHIVKRVEKNDGTIVAETKPEKRRRAIEAVTDRVLIGMLEQVVATGGGHKAYVDGYRIAGKTGTAQKVQPFGKGYMEGHYIASFCGFAPVEDPELVVYIMIDDPSGVYYGGQIAAPVAGKIFTQLFRYLHIEPSGDPLSRVSGIAGGIPTAPKAVRKEAVVPDVAGMDTTAAQLTIEAAGFFLDARGHGKAVSQSTTPGTILPVGSKITVWFELSEKKLGKD